MRRMVLPDQGCSQPHLRERRRHSDGSSNVCVGLHVVSIIFRPSLSSCSLSFLLDCLHHGQVAFCRRSVFHLPFSFYRLLYLVILIGASLLHTYSHWHFECSECDHHRCIIPCIDGMAVWNHRSVSSPMEGTNLGWPVNDIRFKFVVGRAEQMDLASTEIGVDASECNSSIIVHHKYRLVEEIH